MPLLVAIPCINESDKITYVTLDEYQFSHIKTKWIRNVRIKEVLLRSATHLICRLIDKMDEVLIVKRLIRCCYLVISWV